MPPRPKKPKKRNHPTANLDSEQGHAEYEQTLSALGGPTEEGKDLLRQTKSDLWWTSMLPGFEEAVDSLAKGLLQTMAKSQYVRQLAKRSENNEKIVFNLLEQIRLGVTAPSQVASKIFAAVSDEEQQKASKQYQRAVYEAQRTKKPPKAWEFLKKLQQDYDVPDDFAVNEALTLGRKTSVEQDVFLKLWVGAGYWLAEAQDIADSLKEYFLCQQVTSSFRPPSAESVRVWKWDLKLISYAGHGRLKFAEGGKLVPDTILKNEFLDELRRIGVSEEQILEKFGVARYSI